jgi:phage/plasmid-associated DNA primase
MIISCNTAPVFYEATGKLATRLLMLKFNKSWLGREDTTLGDRLAEELTGIANWALVGLKRLRANGRFTMPAASQEAVREFMRDNSHERAFIQDCLIVERRCDPRSIEDLATSDKPLTATKAEVETAYRAWCKDNDYQVEEDKWQWVWRRMKENLPQIKGDKGRGDQRKYSGIALKRTTDNGAK